MPITTAFPNPTSHVTLNLPFFTSYDPPGSSEGTLDPLGLYQIADQLAVRLVPAVRERMQRIRFLTAIAVGASVIEGMEENPETRDAAPFLVWEWLVVEAFVRSADDSQVAAGVAGVQVAKRAVKQLGYVDAGSYLKTPRIFGFHGVYKRLALHLGLIDVHLRAGPNAQQLVDAWAAGLSSTVAGGAGALISKWTKAVRRSLDQRPPRTRPGWAAADWLELASALDPDRAKTREKRWLREKLLATGEGQLAALREIWALVPTKSEDATNEPELHRRLKQKLPAYGPLLDGIRAYEAFARTLQDAFDCFRLAASTGQSFSLASMASRREFTALSTRVPKGFAAADRALEGIAMERLAPHALFRERFGSFSEPLSAEALCVAICAHHERVQKAKSAAGKRSWFDSLGAGQIYLRQAYRLDTWTAAPAAYVHDYRTNPITRFVRDLK